MVRIASLLLVLALVVSCASKKTVQSEWIQLFNGQNLDGWKVKFAGNVVGENYKNTFRVENGNLVVSYDEYENFNDKFGHLISDKVYSHYKLRVEYRFVGNQVNGGAAWAYRNNGLMLHSQSAESMEPGQDFPTSIEVQLLGGIGDDDRTNLNVCTPGTIIDINGKPLLSHCYNSSSKVINGEDWTTVEIEVYGDSIFKHLFNGELVLEYTHPRLDPDSPDYQKLLSPETGDRLTKGHIAIQAESHRTEFRKIELLNLSDDCED
ncbi:MAG: DUF1080 domain-containing protein [Prolixibacteraceae bacterium]